MEEIWNASKRGSTRMRHRGTANYVPEPASSRDGEQPGRVMVQRLDSDAPDPVAPSFRSWLEDFANKLEDDEFAYSESDGCVKYADQIEID